MNRTQNFSFLLFSSTMLITMNKQRRKLHRIRPLFDVKITLREKQEKALSNFNISGQWVLVICTVYLLVVVGRDTD